MTGTVVQTELQRLLGCSTHSDVERRGPCTVPGLYQDDHTKSFQKRSSIFFFQSKGAVPRNVCAG